MNYSDQVRAYLACRYYNRDDRFRFFCRFILTPPVVARYRQRKMVKRWEREFPELKEQEFGSIIEELGAYWALRRKVKGSA